MARPPRLWDLGQNPWEQRVHGGRQGRARGDEMLVRGHQVLILQDEPILESESKSRATATDTALRTGNLRAALACFFSYYSAIVTAMSY